MSLDNNEIKAVANFNNLLADLNNAYCERSEEISLLATSLIAEQPAVLLGPAGTGKSALVRSFADSVVYNDDELGFFQYLLNKFTTPSELFGAPSIKELKENDRLVLNTSGKLPTARVAFLDEVFKCSSATLNSLLTILNEREYDDGSGIRKKAATEVIIGASNEMPEDGLDPLWDRFVLRHWVQDIRHEDSFLSLLTGEGIGEVTESVTIAEINLIRNIRDRVDINGILDTFLKLRKEMEKLNIRVSGRKWRKCVEVVKSVAAIKGRERAVASDCGVLEYVLWDQPEQCVAIAKTLANVAAGDAKKALELADSAREKVTFNSEGKVDFENATIKDVGACKRALNAVLKEMEALDGEDDMVLRCLEEVRELYGEVCQCLKKLV